MVQGVPGTFLLVSALAGAQAVAAPPPETFEQRMQRMERAVAALQKDTAQQDGEIEELRLLQGERWHSAVRAQQIREIVRDVLADADTRTSFSADGATAGHDGSFFIASADGNFRLTIRGQIQARAAFNSIPSASAPSGKQEAYEYGFELRRAKLFFVGHVVDPTWRYNLQLAFERDSGAISAPTARAQVSLEAAFIEKELAPGVALRGGEWLLQWNQEEMVGSGDQQFVERAIVNSYFSPKYVSGAQLWIQKEWWRTFLSTTDGGANRDLQIIQPKNLVEWAVAARGELKLAGAWSQFLAYQGWVGSDFAAMLGVGVNWQRGTGVQGVRNTIGNGTIPGAPGGGEGASLLTYTTDLNLRGNGWSLSAALYGNLLYGFEPTPLVTQDVSSYAATLQGGVFVTEGLEMILRYEGLWVSDGIQDATVPNALNTQTLNVLTGGVNLYFRRNQSKLTFDVGYAFNAVKFGSGLYGEGIGGANWRSTLTPATASGGGEGELVVRTQLQMLF